MNKDGLSKLASENSPLKWFSHIKGGNMARDFNIWIDSCVNNGPEGLIIIIISRKKHLHSLLKAICLLILISSLYIFFSYNNKVDWMIIFYWCFSNASKKQVWTFDQSKLRRG